MTKNENENNLNIEIPEVYSNEVMINTSPFEFEITLGLSSSNYQGVKPVANLRMSPQFAKEIAKVLVEKINVYQDSYGKIKSSEVKTEN